MVRRWALSLALLLLAASSLLAQAPPGTASPDQTRKAFLKLVTPRKTDLAPAVRVLEDGPEFVREKADFYSEPGQKVAMLMVRPKDAAPVRRPAVLVLHGTRGRKEAFEPFLKELAAKGFFAAATDARWHGEWAKADYEDALIGAYRTGKGHPWLYDTVTDTIRALDYLQTRGEVDRGRIGLMGISMGGMNTWLTAAVDSRVKVAVPVIGVTSFAHAVESGRFQPRAATLPRFHQAVADALEEKEVNEQVVRAAWNRVLPGILNRFDCPQMLPLIAPRPLLILNGELDDRCPVEGVRQCYAAAEAAYGKRNAADRLKMIVYPNTGHTFTPEMRAEALTWLQRWLGTGEGVRG